MILSLTLRLPQHWKAYPAKLERLNVLKKPNLCKLRSLILFSLVKGD